MEAWETAPIEACTPRQRRQREIREREEEILSALGIRGGSSATFAAVNRLAKEDSSVYELADAVEQLDRDLDYRAAAYSHADAAIAVVDQLRRDDRGQNVEAIDRLERRLRREAGEALHWFEAACADGPKAALRAMLLDRLRQLGVRLPNDHQRCCRDLLAAYRAAWTYGAIAGRHEEYARLYAEWSNDLAAYGCSV